MSDKIKGTSTSHVDAAPAAVHVAAPVRPLVQAKSVKVKPQSSLNRQRAIQKDADDSKVEKDISVNAADDLKDNGRQPSKEIDSIFLRDFGAITNRRDNSPYSTLKVFEKVSAIHSVVSKITADQSLDTNHEGVAVLKEHFFMVFELERLSHAR